MNDELYENLEWFRMNMQTHAWDDDNEYLENDLRSPMSMVIVMSKTKQPVSKYDTDERGMNSNILETEHDCVQIASKTMLQLFSLMKPRYDLNHDDEYVSMMHAWCNARIRKIVKHEKPSRFNKLDDVNWLHVRNKLNDTECIAYNPMLESMQSSESFFKPVHKLQVKGYDAIRSNIHDNVKPFLLITVNDQLHMTTGKMIAQCLHAVQVAVYNLNDRQFQAWVQNGCIVNYNYGSPDADGSIAIIDAGFTEIPAGSLTASAELIE